jgi:serine/threonine protein kinase
MHEEALLKNKEAFKPFRRSSLYFSAFRSERTLYRFNDTLFTIKATHALLGEGISGKVKKHLSSTGPVAVKKMPLETRRQWEDYETEVNILRALGRFKGTRLVGQPLPSKAYVVTEYYSGVTLLTLMNAIRFSPTECVRLMHKMAKELDQLHQLGYVHNDIKPENFMTHSRLSIRDEVKLIDFAYARPKNQPFTSGTPEYAAPEILSNTKRPRTQATDIYSLGVVFYQILRNTLNPPPELQQLVDSMRARRESMRPDLQSIQLQLDECASGLAQFAYKTCI